MTPEFAIQIVREALMTAFWLSAPLLAVGFVVGIVDQPDSDRHLHSGLGFQRHPPTDRLSDDA